MRELHPESNRFFVFEYDNRFAAYGDAFVLYDYRQPTKLPETILAQGFDMVIADPPFLSEECATKVAETISALQPTHILYCTGWKLLYVCTRIYVTVLACADLVTFADHTLSRVSFNVLAFHV